MAACALALLGGGCGDDVTRDGAAPADLAGAAPDLAKPRCGDGVVAGREECDNGENRPGSGCEPTCTFTCTKGQNDGLCDDGDPCNGVESCGADHACTRPARSPDGTDCGKGRVCRAGTCVQPS